MPIAKGRTNCEAEREVLIQGFVDLLDLVNKSKIDNEAHIKAQLYDINKDNISLEEKKTNAHPFLNLLSEIEEKNIRIRRTILIGIFSFWELSLKHLLEYHKIEVKKKEQRAIKPNKEKKTPIFNSTDYLYTIFDKDKPDEVCLINDYIREFRNFMTHGGGDDNRFNIIASLQAQHPEFHIEGKKTEFYIGEYSGLKEILIHVVNALDITEKKAVEITQSNIKTNDK